MSTLIECLDYTSFFTFLSDSVSVTVAARVQVSSWVREREKQSGCRTCAGPWMPRTARAQRPAGEPQPPSGRRATVSRVPPAYTEHPMLFFSLRLPRAYTYTPAQHTNLDVLGFAIRISGWHAKGHPSYASCADSYQRRSNIMHLIMQKYEAQFAKELCIRYRL